VKDINTIIPAINYNSIEILQTITNLKNSYIKINQLTEEINDLSSNNRNIFNKLTKDINTFKTILNKFETCYLCNISLLSNGNKQIKVFDFTAVYDKDYKLEQYAEKNKSFKFYKIIEYVLSLDISNIQVIDEKISMKHIFKKTRQYSLNLDSIIEILSTNGFFINKEEFKKNYEFSN